MFEMKIGNSILRAHNDVAVKTVAEIEAIIDNSSKIATTIYKESKNKIPKEETG